MPRKTRQKNRQLKVDMKTAKVLRTVKSEEAFHFYEAVGQPTGERATSLLDFLEKIKTVKLESLEFHLQRKDFQNWLRKTIGDSELARKVERMRKPNDDNMRTRIHSTIEEHLKELRKGAHITLSVNEKFVAASTP